MIPRYFMNASNGSVVAHESDTGQWVKYEDFETIIKDLRRDANKAIQQGKFRHEALNWIHSFRRRMDKGVEVE